MNFRSWRTIVGICWCFWGAILAGCGGNSSPSTGPSYQQQVEQAEQITDPEARARGLFQIALGQFKGKDDLGAEETMKIATRACNAVQDPLARCSLYTDLADIQAYLGNKLQAGEALKEAEKSAAEIESAESHALALCKIATVHGQRLKSKNDASDSLDVAENLLAEIEDPQGRALAQVAIVKACAAAQLAKQADRVLITAISEAKVQTDPALQATIFTGISSAQVALDQKPGALESLEAALTASEGIESKYKRVYTLIEIAKAYAQAGDKAKAGQVYSDGESLVDQIPEPDLKSQARTLVEEARPKVQ